MAMVDVGGSRSCTSLSLYRASGKGKGRDVDKVLILEERPHSDEVFVDHELLLFVGGFVRTFFGRFSWDSRCGLGTSRTGPVLKKPYSGMFKTTRDGGTTSLKVRCSSV